MLQQQEGQTCPGFAARTRHSHALHEWSDFMSFKISCTVSMTRTLHSQFLGAYQECTVFNSQTFRRIKLCSVYCHLATQIFLLAYSHCNSTPKKKKKNPIPDNQQHKNLTLNLKQCWYGVKITSLFYLWKIPFLNVLFIVDTNTLGDIRPVEKQFEENVFLATACYSP